MSTIPKRPDVDPERDRAPGPFADGRGYSGQDYRREDEAALGAAQPSGAATSWTPPPADPHATHGDRDLPPEVGKRAWSDPKTGEVHGSGAGAGGGATGEDYDGDSAGGDGDPITGPDPHDAGNAGRV